MGKVTDIVLWLFVPGLLTMRRSSTPLSRAQSGGLLLTDTITRLLLLGAMLWMIAIEKWEIAALLAVLLVVIATLRALTTAYLLRGPDYNAPASQQQTRTPRRKRKRNRNR
ncbi:MAG TPA: hypothetical protein VFY10_16865 [Dehalococcoidia bacterium]|nr:hypothetical protein [Dehalococcoidia bacterium]